MSEDIGRSIFHSFSSFFLLIFWKCYRDLAWHLFYLTDACFPRWIVVGFISTVDFGFTSKWLIVTAKLGSDSLWLGQRSNTKIKYLTATVVGSDESWRRYYYNISPFFGVNTSPILRLLNFSWFKTIYIWSLLKSWWYVFLVVQNF